MKTSKNSLSTLSPKGVRLHWQPLSDVKPVKLTSNMTTGKFVSEKELKNRNNNSNSISILVP